MKNSPNAGFDLQPRLIGELVELRPLVPEDFEALYAVASDPLVWELHPERNRYQRPVFEKFFAAAIASGGALTVIDRTTGSIIGSSRYSGFDAEKNSIEIGYTFIGRGYWGRGHNSEMKKLMLGHAFRRVADVLFYIGDTNFRSRKAVEKLGAEHVDSVERTPFEGAPYTAVIYRLSRD